MNSLAQRFAHAVQWNVALSVATMIAQVGITAILARLLTPSDFGAFAIANVAFVIGAQLGLTGLLQAIVREPVLDRERLGSAIFLSLLVSVALAVIGILLAPLAGLGSISASSVVEDLVRLMSLSIVISGITSPAQAIMQRELRFRELGFMQLAGIVLGSGATTISLALAGNGPWSLAYGSIANMAIVSASCWWKLRDRWCISWHGAHVIRIGLVGAQMTLVRILDGLWGQLPLVVAHARLSSSEVGLYQRAQTIAGIGIQYTSGNFNSVLFPAMASRQNRTDLQRELVPPLFGLYCLFLFSVAAVVAILASDIVAVLLGPNWEGAAKPLSVIMIACACLLCSQPASSQLETNAVLKPRIISAGFGATSVALCSLLLVGKYGLTGIALAAVIAGMGTSIINLVAAVRHFAIDPRTIVVWLIPSFGVVGLLTSALMICHPLVMRAVGSPMMRLVAMTAVAAIVFVIAFRLFVHGSRRRKLSKYLSPSMSRLVIVIAGIFGLRPGDSGMGR
jgi:lipopolysaccharide exporter